MNELMRNGGWKNYALTAMGGVLLISLTVTGFLLSGYQRSLEANQEKIIIMISRTADESKKERLFIQSEIAKLCERLAKHESVLERHEMLLRMPFPARRDIYKDERHQVR